MCILPASKLVDIVHSHLHVKKSSYAQEKVGLEALGYQPTDSVKQGTQPDEFLHFTLNFIGLIQIDCPLLSMFPYYREILCEYFSKLIDKSAGSLG